MFKAINGGCLCGGIRYCVASEPIDAGYCHCRLCQRSSGAPVLAWLTVSIEDFAYTRGTPAIYHSTGHSQREFCPVCGTQLAFRRTRDPQTVDVTLASLDDTSVVSPQYHIWMQSRVTWFHIDDALPRFDDDGPDSGQ